MIQTQSIRKDFPILQHKIEGKPLIYFDNAATTQKPKTTLEALESYYKTTNSNIHRGAHTLSQQATQEYEDMRLRVQSFLNAPNKEEIIFTKGVTESINLLANSFIEKYCDRGDEIILSVLEHHSNIVPWQLKREKHKIKIQVIPIDERGIWDMEAYKKLFTKKTKLVSILHISNSIGVIQDIKKMIDYAHTHAVPVCIDGAQSAARLPVDVQDLDCDFYTFSAHKCYGPTGVGILYGKKKYLQEMPPYQGGGSMIKNVTFEQTTFNDLPHKFEAGTPNIADIIAFGKSLEYIENIGRENIYLHEKNLSTYCEEELSKISSIRILAAKQEKAGVISFLSETAHHYDIGMLLDSYGIAVRTGHHCNQPFMDWMKIKGTVRVSFAIYNTEEEIDRFIKSLKEVLKILK